jgi:deoxyribodipyrimidine photo-lyase
MPLYNIFWFRRDLRLADNAGLYHALKSELPVKPIFIFDTEILNKLDDKQDARVTFIHGVISELKDELEKQGSSLDVYYGNPTEILKDLSENSEVNDVYTNRDYERYAIARDESVKKVLASQNKNLHTYKDHIIFEKDEILKSDGTPYVVFTPYKRKWLEKLTTKVDESKQSLSYFFKPYPTEKYFDNLYAFDGRVLPSLEDMGFEKSSIPIPSKTTSQGVIRKYDEQRNFPAVEGTTRLGVHFRFGTISIRDKAKKAQTLNDTFLSELVWRDFYSMILQHFPKVEDQSFREKYEAIEWRNNEKEFEAWCKGQTGYPIVDAGMRELNNTGHMHNRVRMIVASFLTKHLLIDWRWGERYFAEKLLDYDLASNSGGWQWAAGCGTDAAPYFRIFNPYTQADKFDKKRKYIKKWVPEEDSDSYVDPIVDHKEARERCLKTYKSALNGE